MSAIPRASWQCLPEARASTRPAGRRVSACGGGFGDEADAREAVAGGFAHQLGDDAVGDVDKSGQEDVIVDFGPAYGIFIWQNNTTWKQIHSTSAKRMAVADLDGNGLEDVVIDFGSAYGLWVYNNNASWTQIHGSPSFGMAVGDIDSNGRQDVIVDFGSAYGSYAYMNGGPTWRQLHGITSSYLTTGEVDGN